MATFTSAGSGNWRTAGTWDVGVGYPAAGDTVIILNTHTVTANTGAATCTTLTINAGGVLTDATNNVGVTVSGDAVVSGTLTGGTAAISFGSLKVPAGGTYTATSGTTTITSRNADTYSLEALGTITHNNGTFNTTMALYHAVKCSSTLYNYTLTMGSTNECRLYANFACTTLVINSGNFSTNAAGNYNITVSGGTSNLGIINCYAGTCQFGASGFVTSWGLLNYSGATFNGGTGTHSISSMVTQRYQDFISSSGTTTITDYKNDGVANVALWVQQGALVWTAGSTVVFSNTAQNVVIEHSTNNTNMTFQNLTISSTNKIVSQYTDFAPNLIILGDLTISANATFTYSAHNVTFNKVGTSTISGSGTSNFYGLLCSGSTQVNISEDIGILDNGELTPTTGGSFVPASGKSITFA